MASDRATWTILGSGTATPTAKRGASGHLLTLGGAHVLFDAGAGTLQRLARAGVALDAIDRIFFTHYHLDHVMELPSLLFALKNPALDRDRTLEITGPRGLHRIVDGLTGVFDDWMKPTTTRVVYREIDAGATIDLDGCRLTTAPTRHVAPDERWGASLAYRIALDGGIVIAYSGDTGYAPEVVALAERADVFVCECALDAAEATDRHLDAVLAGRMADEAAVGKLVLTHFYPEVALDRVVERAGRHYAGPVIIAEDGMVLDLSH